jgi:DNA helicase-2/ATP-dependent DNA helicase PcrA
MSRTTLFGPPGTGKTTTLSKWSRQAAEKHGGENVMICSLTKTAAAEIRSREIDVPDENVGTLHAHAYRSLSEDGYTVLGPKQAEAFNQDVPPEMRLPVQRVDTDDIVMGETNSILATVDLYRARMIPTYEWPKQAQEFWNLYVDFKEREHLLDFTDMIETALKTQDCPTDYIIMDEAQDCSALEFALLQKWADQCKGVVIAGDDDQAAYEWRGASVNAFLSFSERQDVLPRSYRLPQRVKEYADRWIHRISNRKEKEYDSRAEDGHVAELDTNRPEDIVEHASKQPGTSMILTTCGYMTRPLLACLKENAEPFCNPYRVTGQFASQWNPMLSGGAASVTAADSMRSFLTQPPTFASTHRWVKEVSASFLTHGTKAMLKRRKGDDTLVAVEEFVGMLGADGLEQWANGNVEWFVKAVGDAKRRAMLSYRARVYRKHGIEGLNPKAKIIVGTIHSVKGGQADNVYVIPDLSVAAREAWHHEEDPIIRQFYIGMTRARENLFLVRPKRRSVIEW